MAVAPFQRILVPLDLSGRHARALRLAREIARQGGARVTLLHVIQRVEGVPPRDVAGFYRRLERTAKRLLAQAARVFTAAGVPVAVAVFVGSTPQEIVAFADAKKIDLIVLASHRVGPRPGAGLGMTSYRVALLCRCPVLLVK